MRTVDFLRPTTIEKVIQEASNIRSFVFKDHESCKAFPGQFAMVWLPRVGEFPMSLSFPLPRDRTSITVKAMGPGSERLYNSRVGEKIGIRGPYGNFFELHKMKKVVLVGGGTGMVPMISLAYKISRKQNMKASMVIGARTKEELPFLQASWRLLGKRNVFPSTDDGSYGCAGLAHEMLGELLKKKKYDAVFSCGPERMMLAVYQIAKTAETPVQFSLERIMKCGIGICGSCCIADYVLCKDGPVFGDAKVERMLKEFGVLFRDNTGALAKL